MAALQQGQQIACEMASGNAQDGAPRGAQQAAGAPGAAAGPPIAAAGSVMPGAADAGASPAGDAGAAGGPARGGFNGGQAPSPEQMEQIRQRMAQGGGAPRGGGGFNGGQRPTPEQMEQFRQRMGQGGEGGFGGFGAAGGARQGAQRRGTVMVKTADDTLEPRQVVIGVTDRVYGQVLE